MTIKELMTKLNITTDELVKVQNLYEQEVYGDVPWLDEPRATNADSVLETIEDLEDDTPTKLYNDERVYACDRDYSEFLIHTVHGWMLDCLNGDYCAVIIHNDTLILSGHDGTRVYDLIPAPHAKKRWGSECLN